MDNKYLYETIVKCTYTEILVPYLCEEGLLDMEDAQRATKVPEAFSRFLQSLPRTLLHSRFAECMKRSSAKHGHLGHQFIAAVLGDRQFADDNSMRLSDEYRKRIQGNMTALMDIDLPTLMPKLLHCNLITLKESEVLLPLVPNSSWSRTSTVFELVRILDSKGPTAYFLFVECLRNEEEHPPHKELYDLVCITEREVPDNGKRNIRLGKRKCAAGFQSRSELLPPLSKQRVPARLKIEEPLIGEEYDQRRLRFESYYHNGQWDLVEKESRKCTESGIPEQQVVGTLELALSWIFRRNKSKVLGLVKYAKSLCQVKTFSSNNGTILLARCEYYLSLLYRYLQDFHTAEDHVREARSILFEAESSAHEDKSFTYYCSAIIAAEQLTAKSPPCAFKRAESLFESAIDHAHCAGNLEVLVTHSRLQLARLYLGTTHTKFWTTQDKKMIEKSRQCLENLKLIYDSLDIRCKTIFHLNMSDLHQSCGEVNQAIDAAKQALRMALEVQLVLEIEAAEMRVKSLTHTTACVLT